MADWHLTTPVAFLIFNRPDTAATVFAAIARVKPPKLLVIADGPRPDRPGEGENCAATRALIDRVDWPCEVLTNYSDTNLGCKRRVSSGLDWVFQTVEEAIILEDDCVPHPTFFPYCQELLAKYRDDTRVMHIGGVNFLDGKRHDDTSYYFSHYPSIWGWASWRRAWQHYDVDMKAWLASEDKSRYLLEFPGKSEQRYWEESWNAVAQGKIDTWDYQWMFACAAQKGLAAMPWVNLITNIGYRPDATHTTGESFAANRSAEEMRFPIKHPDAVTSDAVADEHTRRLFRPSHTRLYMQGVWRKIQRLLSPSARKA